MILDIEIIFVACLISISCVIPGVFLVLRGVSMMSDAVSHSSLLGTVLIFFIVKDLHSPFLIVGAAVMGVLTVVLTELLILTRLVKKDAAIGLIFPALFSVAVILISRHVSDVHLDADSVLFGEIAFAPFDRFKWRAIDLGPKSIWLSGIIGFINLSVFSLCYKEIKMVVFDYRLAESLGFNPSLVYYVMMIMTSVTAVGVFSSVGSILVVSFMIVPPATAYLLTRSYDRLIFLAVFLGISSCILGYMLAFVFNVSISGSIATVSGIQFLSAFFLSPKRGLVIYFIQRKKKRIIFASRMLIVQLFNHEGSINEKNENTILNMTTHMNWSAMFAQKVVLWSVQNGLVARNKEKLFLTPLGREWARREIVS